MHAISIRCQRPVRFPQASGLSVLDGRGYPITNQKMAGLAWTTPEELALWWDAGGERLTVCEMDLRPGGSFRFVAPSHMHMPFTGTYVEIAPPERLVFEAMDAIGRVLLAEAGQGTRMTVEIVCNSAEHLDHYVKLGVANGTAKTCDNLVNFLKNEGWRTGAIGPQA